MHKSDEVSKNPEITYPKPYTSTLPFPQRMANAKLDLRFQKLLEVLTKLYINIPFTDALQMPSYAKFLKEILSNKRKLEEHKTVALTEECSAAIQTSFQLS